MDKRYYEMYGVGTSKYSVHCHNGIDTYKDGSPFYDIRLFKNKKKLAAFLTKLSKEGYRERRFNEL